MATRKKTDAQELILETDNMKIADAVQAALERRQKEIPEYKGIEFVFQKRGDTYEVVGIIEGRGKPDIDLICEYVDGYVDAIEDAMSGGIDRGEDGDEGEDGAEVVEVIRGPRGGAGGGAVRERGGGGRRRG